MNKENLQMLINHIESPYVGLNMRYFFSNDTDAFTRISWLSYEESKSAKYACLAGHCANLNGIDYSGNDSYTFFFYQYVWCSAQEFLDLGGDNAKVLFELWESDYG